MLMSKDNQAIRHFVRGTLGCNCPDSVFDHIELTRPNSNESAAFPITKLVVGGRLLIYVLHEPPWEFLKFLLPRLVAAGKAEREACQLNRLRIVIVTEQPTGPAEQANALFANSQGEDANVHLHLIAKKDMVDLGVSGQY
jgi:hypothetical protein